MIPLSEAKEKLCFKSGPYFLKWCEAAGVRVEFRGDIWWVDYDRAVDVMRSYKRAVILQIEEDVLNAVRESGSSLREGAGGP